MISLLDIAHTFIYNIQWQFMMIKYLQFLHIFIDNSHYLNHTLSCKQNNSAYRIGCKLVYLLILHTFLSNEITDIR